MTSKRSGAPRPASARPSERAAQLHVALLRGINVGRNKRVSMAHLRDAFVAAGYDDARTVLNSGNVVFTAKVPLAATDVRRLEATVQRRTGIDSRIVVLNRDQLEAVIEANPLLAHMTDESRMMVSLLAPGVDGRSVRRPDSAAIHPDLLAATEHAVYEWLPDGLTESRIPLDYWRAFKDSATRRNWRTLTRLLSAMR